MSPAGTNDADNVDYGEIGNFARLADRWWDPHGEMRPLHAINPLRASFVEQHAPSRAQQSPSLAGLRVLDVGCGGGLLSEALAQRGAQVTGIDAGAAQIAAASAHAAAGGLNIDYRAVTTRSLLEETAWAATFDVVTCMEVDEHVPDVSLLVAECAALARPGGRVFFSTVNRTARAFALAIVGAEYLLGLLPRGTHDFERFVTPAELEAAGRRAGMSLLALRGLRYAPLSGRHALVRDVSVNYAACFETA